MIRFCRPVEVHGCLGIVVLLYTGLRIELVVFCLLAAPLAEEDEIAYSRIG